MNIIAGTSSHQTARPIPQIGIAWSSKSGSTRIREKSVPLESFFDILDDVDTAEVISFQRCLDEDDRKTLRSRYGRRCAIVSTAALPLFAEDYQCQNNAGCSAQIPRDGGLEEVSFRKGDLVSTDDGWIVNPDNGWVKVRSKRGLQRVDS